ncbi:uncharacterized protein F5147DRAFT_784422, partial [Suillus discolor]
MAIMGYSSVGYMNRVVIFMQTHSHSFSPAMPRCTTVGCTYFAKDPRLLNKHVRAAHTEFAFVGGLKLRRHSDGSFHCPACNKSSPDPLTLSTHHKREHLPADDPPLNLDQADLNDDGLEGGGSPNHEEEGSRPANQSRSPHPTPPIRDELPSPATSRKRRRSKNHASNQVPRGVVSVPSDTAEPTAIPTLSPADSRTAIAALHGISFIVDPTYKLAICIDCEIAVPAKHVRGHAVGQHSFKAPPQDELDANLASLGCVDKFVRPLETIAPIVGLKLLKGLMCTVDGCKHLTAAT